MASDAKVTVEEMLAAITSQATCGEACQGCRRLRAAAAYIRRANAVLGEECACGHFEIRHAVYVGYLPCVGCKDCNVMCRTAAGGTEP